MLCRQVISATMPKAPLRVQSICKPRYSSLQAQLPSSILSLQLQAPGSELQVPGSKFGILTRGLSRFAACPRVTPSPIQATKNQTFSLVSHLALLFASLGAKMSKIGKKTPSWSQHLPT